MLISWKKVLCLHMKKTVFLFAVLFLIALFSACAPTAPYVGADGIVKETDTYQFYRKDGTLIVKVYAGHVNHMGCPALKSMEFASVKEMVNFFSKGDFDEETVYLFRHNMYPYNNGEAILIQEPVVIPSLPRDLQIASVSWSQGPTYEGYLSEGSLERLVGQFVIGFESHDFDKLISREFGDDLPEEELERHTSDRGTVSYWFRDGEATFYVREYDYRMDVYVKDAAGNAVYIFYEPDLSIKQIRKLGVKYYQG